MALTISLSLVRTFWLTRILPIVHRVRIVQPIHALKNMEDLKRLIYNGGVIFIIIDATERGTVDELYGSCRIQPYYLV